MVDTDGGVLRALAVRDDLGPWTLAWLERFARRAPHWTWRSTRHLLVDNPRSSARLVRRLDRISAARDKWATSDPALRPRIIVNAAVFAGLLMAAGIVFSWSTPPSTGARALTIALVLAGPVFVHWRQRRQGRVFLVAAPGPRGMAVAAVLCVTALVLALDSPLAGVAVLLLLALGVTWRYRVPELRSAAASSAAGNETGITGLTGLGRWLVWIMVFNALRGLTHLTDGDPDPAPRPGLSSPTDPTQVILSDLPAGTCVGDLSTSVLIPVPCGGAHIGEVFGRRSVALTADTSADLASLRRACEELRGSYTSVRASQAAVEPHLVTPFTESPSRIALCLLVSRQGPVTGSYRDRG